MDIIKEWKKTDYPTESNDQINTEIKCFRLYQQVDWHEYKKKRLEFLNGLPHARFGKIWLEHYSPKIGLFPGSFNPFHKGHLNILLKAEKLFDKVIIAFGNNPDKDPRVFPIPQSIKNRQIVEYSSLLTDLVQSLPYPVTVIRGLRNSTDFQYEQNQYRYMKELYPELNIVNIFCDKEFEHISSSGIRTLQKYGKHFPYLPE
ncbi:MAG: adenylyltransferase/cytidyltransferase family protein [Bacteroidia bacterium]|nr:adenylyltransferase/cytidyltransferase family protein [Bacteroidia bacterium]